MTKRTFFKSIMGAVAAVALAPEIAFGVRLKMPELPQGQLIGYLMMAWKDGGKAVLTRISDGHQSRADFEDGLMETKDDYDFLQGYKVNKWSVHTDYLF